MELSNSYDKVFGKIPILGMIHLAGQNPVRRALEELALFEEEGIDGAIIENYHGSVEDVIGTLEETHRRKLAIGINILPNEFYIALPLAKEYGADFVQLDHVAGIYRSGQLNYENYRKLKQPETIVLGGVWPKYYEPIKGSDLERDLKEGMERAEAIVVTGAGTGQETPLDKIRKYREIIGDHPLVVGAGLTPDNAYEQLCISNGAIVGTSLKIDDNTYNPMDRQKIRDFMSVVKEARNYQVLSTS
ncbi:MAG: BtpA/SgcQ family protein [Bacteroidota bacterium]